MLFLEKGSSKLSEHWEPALCYGKSQGFAQHLEQKSEKKLDIIIGCHCNCVLVPNALHPSPLTISWLPTTYGERDPMIQLWEGLLLKVTLWTVKLLEERRHY